MKIICILIIVLVALDGYESIAETAGSRAWIFMVLRREKCEWKYGSLHSENFCAAWHRDQISSEELTLSGIDVFI